MPTTVIQNVNGKKEWDLVLNPPRQSKMRDNTHQLTGTDREGNGIYMLGTLPEMERKRGWYRMHDGKNLVIAERMMVDERCGLTTRDAY